jgi:hypothetical protein
MVTLAANMRNARVSGSKNDDKTSLFAKVACGYSIGRCRAGVRDDQNIVPFVHNHAVCRGFYSIYSPTDNRSDAIAMAKEIFRDF